MTEDSTDNHTADETATGGGEQAVARDVVESEEVAVADIDELEEVIPFTYSITSFGADFLVDGLVNRLSSGDIIIPTYDPKPCPAGPIRSSETKDRSAKWR